MKVGDVRALLLVGLATVAAGSADAMAPRAANAAEAARRLEADSPGRTRVRLDPLTGTADLVAVEPGAVALSGSTAKARSLDFLARYKELFGITDPYTELADRGYLVDRMGRTHLRFQQVQQGIPVFGGELRAHLDAAGRLTSVSGRVVPEVSVDLQPSLAPRTAEGIAAATVAKRTGRPPAELGVSQPRLMVYREGLLAGRPGADHLAWEVTVTDGAGVAERLYVDAHGGAVLNRIPLVHDLYRTVSKTSRGQIVWREGDPLPYSGDTAAANAEINQLIATAGESYDLFANLSGGTFLSWDGDEADMPTLYNPDKGALPPDSSCPNAFWSTPDRLMTVCTGMAADDVVAHEWTHAYTDSTDGLIYQYQPGALNESFSDIFGETVDLLNGLGDDSPDRPRGDGACSALGANPSPTLTVDAPPALAGGYFVGGAEFNPTPPFAVSGRVELVDDGTSPASDACQTLTGFTPGHIALIDRGTCNFYDKVRQAQDAGAAAAIVANNDGDTLVNMGLPEGSSALLSIPAVFVTQSDGEAIKDALAGDVRATIFLPAASDRSVRWLIAEGSDGGAIRDMWNPACFGDPGSVLDASYYCAEDDNGGVHRNSGVPNHVYALLVDGGSYNGRTVRAIGLVKASNIYWRAMSVYQVPITDFAMHADFVEESCRDLVGAPLSDPATGAVSDQVMSADDCDQVSSAMDAVQMTAYPRCTSLGLLAASPPGLKGNRVAFFEDFDHGRPAGWKLGHQGVYAEYEPRDWQWTEDLPSGGRGGGYFALDSPLIGDCVAGSDDQSGVMQLTSPSIVVPPGSSPTLSFDHWVATEARYDGGLVRISVNGGDFQIVPRDAFTYNPYNLILETTANGNTNPLAGLYAFSGTDSGTSRGSWGQSQADLSGLVNAGDTVRIRFEFGIDGCNGVTGWYVDNVQLRTTDVTPRVSHGRVRP